MYVPETGQEKQGLPTKKVLPTGALQATSHSGHLSTISLQQSLDVLSSWIQETNELSKHQEAGPTSCLFRLK